MRLDGRQPGWRRPRHGSTRCMPPPSLLLLLLLALSSPQPSPASIFGGSGGIHLRHAFPMAAAIFGNLLGNRDAADPNQPLPLRPPPPPPPPLRHSTGPPEAQWEGMPPPPPPSLYGDAVPPDGDYLAWQQREELHLRQLDVLTERLMGLEAAAAADRNALREWQENCTALMEEATALRDGRDEDARRCAELQEQCAQAAADREKLRQELKVAVREAEDLAALIEKHRLSFEDDEETFPKKKAKKRRGFFAWLFGWGRKMEEDGLDDAYEQARSTLLKALQTERNSVDELESAVASLQQNNSAIAEQVQSRDHVIEELNGRIAIFEEDKVVLKAALKQLQKEMKEEAPKTQKLFDDFKSAQKEIKQLQKEIETLMAAHQKQIAKLQNELAEKQATISEVEGNMTEIGLYVDKLESRLADFSVARRAIEKREEQCRHLEAASNQTAQECDRLKVLVAEYEAEREEHKQLLQELVNERVSLMSQKNQTALEQNAMRLRGSLAKLEIDYKELNRVNRELQTRIHDLETHDKSLKEANKALENQLQSMEAKSNELNSIIDEASREKLDLSSKLENVEQERAELLEKIQRISLATASESTTADEKAKEMEHMLASSVEKITSLSSELAALQNELKSTKAALEAVRKEKEEVEANLRDRVYARSTPNVPPPVLSTTETAAYPDFAMDPPIHISLKNLSPNVSGIRCNALVSTERALSHSAEPVFILPTKTLGASSRGRRLFQSAPTKPPTLKSSPPPREQRIDNSRLVPPAAFTANRTITSGRTANNTAIERRVPFRGIRKFFARTTGVHGVFTKPSTIRSARGRDGKPTPGQKLQPNSKSAATSPGVEQGSKRDATFASSGSAPGRPGMLGSNLQSGSPTLTVRPNPWTTSGQRNDNLVTSSPTGFRAANPHIKGSSSTLSAERNDASQSISAAPARRSFGGGLMKPPPDEGSPIRMDASPAASNANSGHSQ